VSEQQLYQEQKKILLISVTEAETEIAIEDREAISAQDEELQLMMVNVQSDSATLDEKISLLSIYDIHII
jgi:hypothetical protein